MPGSRDHDRRLIDFARNMRSEPTDAERKLWSLLHRGKINGLHFRRQVPVAGYILDFCCLTAGIAIEADVGQHYDDQGKQYDEERSETLLRHGIRVLRFSDVDILKFPDAVQKKIYRMLTDPPQTQASHNNRFG